MDYHAKAVLWNVKHTEPLKQKPFLLEPVSVFAGDSKVTTDDTDFLRFWAHRKLTKERFEALHIFHYNIFKMANWEIVYRTLRKVPKLFQRVMGIAGTME